MAFPGDFQDFHSLNLRPVNWMNTSSKVFFLNRISPIGAFNFSNLAAAVGAAIIAAAEALEKTLVSEMTLLSEEEQASLKPTEDQLAEAKQKAHSSRLSSRLM